MEELRKLSPLQDQIINKTIENVNRKLIAGYRNRNLNPMQGDKPGMKSTIKNTIKASSAKDAMEVANRGTMWKEMVSKTFSHGISSLSTLQFDSQFTVQNGVANGLNDVPETPGVYVLYDANGDVRYIGDSGNVKKRWLSGHLNENRQKECAGNEYKLNSELEKGCTVKVIQCDSVETAAALEASLIAEALDSGEYDLVNSREELKNQQRSRSNIEAKKIKDHSESATELMKGAAKEALKNGGWSVLEQAISECTKALKDELVDLILSGEHKFIDRLKRLFKRVLSSLKNSIGNLAKGIFEFIVNAFSKAINQIYQLAQNLFDLGSAAWNLYKNRGTMSKEQLISKVTETIVIGGNTIFWSSMDLTIESHLSAVTGPFAPFISAFLCALGFGLSSHYLCEFVPKVVDFVIGSFTETKQQLQESARLLVESSQMNVKLVSSLEAYMQSSVALVNDVQSHTEKLINVSTRKVTVREEIEF